jgi:hypothetical protein
MTLETSFRLLFAIIATGMALYLAVNLVTGRARVGGRTAHRRTAPRLYWGSVGKTALLMTGLAITPFLPSQREALPVVFLGLFGGQLFEMLVSGTVQMPAAAYGRAAQPRAYWGWVGFHAAVVILLLFFLIAQRARITIL